MMQQTLLLMGIACVVGAVVGGGSKLAGVEIPLISSPLRQVLLALIGIVLIGSVERVRLALKALSQNQRLVLAVVAILGMFFGVTGTLITQKVLDVSSDPSILSPGPAPASSPTPGAIDSYGAQNKTNPSPPPSSANPSSSPNAAAAPSGPTRYVAELVPVEGATSSVQTDTYTMNVVAYEHSIGMGNLCSSREIGYNLFRAYRGFRATAGVTDAVSTGTKMRFTVLADGTEKARKEVELGKPTPIDADVSGALRLMLRVEPISGGCFDTSAETAVWGSAQIYQ